MSIESAIKEYCKELTCSFAGTLISTDENGCWNINIVFSHPDGDDEVQFDIKPSNFDYGAGKCVELVELWKGFCKENKFKQNSVVKVYIANCYKGDAA